MTVDILSALPVRRGHFLLESGYHAELWFTLEALFASPRELAPLVDALARRLAPYRPTAICGPLLGGAFLAQALAIELDVNFYYSEPEANPSANGLFGATYELPAELRRQARNERVALVDDVISAGSSVRATAAALATAEALIVAVGALVLLGTKATDHFAETGIPIEVLERRDFETWAPDNCPLCRKGTPLGDPISGRILETMEDERKGRQ